MGRWGVWRFTIGLFWAAFKRERGSCSETRISECAGDVGGFVGPYHLGGSRGGTMEEGAKASVLHVIGHLHFLPFRRHQLGTSRLWAKLGGSWPELIGEVQHLTHFPGNHALTIHKDVHSHHLRFSPWLAIMPPPNPVN